MWESRVLQRAFERLELHEGKLSRAVLRGGGGGDVTSLPDAGVGNHPGLPGPRSPLMLCTHSWSFRQMTENQWNLCLGGSDQQFSSPPELWPDLELGQILIPMQDYFGQA